MENTENDHYAVRVLAAALSDPARPMVFWRDGAVRGGRLAEDLLNAAAALAGLGVTTGTTVALLMAGNRPEQLVARYAAHLLGAAVVHLRSMNPRTDTVTFSEQTQTALLGQTGAGVLVTDDDSAARAVRLREAHGGPLAVATTGAPRSGLTSLAAPRTADPPGPEVRTGRAAVSFTSGTSGGPKALAVSYATWDRLVGLLAGQGGPPTRLLAVTPMSHAVAPMLDAALASGGSVVLHEEFDAAAVLRCVEWLRVTDTYLAAPHLYALLDSPVLAGTDVSSLRRVVYSGTPAARHRVDAAARAFGPALVQVYGATETGGISCLTPADHEEPELLGTVGRPFPWVEVQVRGPDSDRELPHGETGEVCVRSPTAMDGYPAADGTLLPVQAGSFLRTGDLGHVDRHGCLVLSGRRSAVIKSGGLKIHPLAVERALLAHPDVAAAAVYGWRDGDDVEQVHAAVQPVPTATCTAEELREHVGAALSDAHRPTRLTFWDALPVTAQGKPDTTALASAPERAGAPRPERSTTCP